MRTLIKNAFNLFGYDVNKLRDEPARLFWALRAWYEARSGTAMDGGFLQYCLANFERSHAQVFQDLFVLYVLSEKRNGFFVEFGATNGVSLSNTLILEREFGWRGILAEPGRTWQDELKNNRNVSIDSRVVWSSSGKSVQFRESSVGEFSTVTAFSRGGRGEASSKVYDVQTVSLDDLLRAHGAPKHIDYISMDTEGSELEILGEFSFEFSVGIFTIEHNYTRSKRRAICDLLTSRGYVRVLEDYSGWDDWYIHSSLLQAGAVI